MVPDTPEESDQDPLAQIVDEAQADQEDIAISEPQPEELEEIAEEVQPDEDETIEPEPLTDTISEAESESDISDEALADASVEEEREDVFQKADSLRVIESIEELDSTGQGMAHVRDDVTRPDTADLEVPKPEEKEPELPKPEYKQPKPDQDTSSEEIASADVEPGQSDTPAPSEIDESIAQANTDTADVDQGQMEENATQSMNATDQPEDEGMSWTWYALIAVAILGAVYFLANTFKPKSGSDSE